MRRKLVLVVGILLISALLVSCAFIPEGAPAGDASGSEEVEKGVLLVGEVDFSRSQLEAMEIIEVEYTGKDDTVAVFNGVLVSDLVAEVGLEGETVVFVASDGYEAELALAELDGCGDCVVAFDGDALRMVLPGFAGSVQVKGVVEISGK